MARRPEFFLHPDGTPAGTYEPEQVRIRLSRRLPGGQRVPVRIDVGTVVVKFDRPDVVVLNVLGVEEGGYVVVFDCRALGRLSDPAYLRRAANPVTATIRAKPQPGEVPDDENAVAEGLATIRVATGRIHWTKDGDASTRDQPIETPADGDTEFLLTVRYERFDPATGEFRYDPAEVEFTHYTGPSLHPRVFGPSQGDEPWGPSGEVGNRDVSRWASLRELPHPQHPGLVPPVESWLRVRAWTMGSIVQREVNTFVPGPNATLLDEKRIPLTLAPAQVVALLLEPTEPVPADYREHELVIQLVRARDHQPVLSGTWAFQVAPEDADRGGRIDETPVTLTRDSNGVVRRAYTPMQLNYEAGKQFGAQILVHRVVGEQRKEADRFVVHLAPALEAEIRAEKKHLEFDPLVLLLQHGQVPSEVHGRLLLRTESPLVGPTGEALTQEDPIVHARVRVFANGAEVPEANVTRSDANGSYEWRLPELEEGLSRCPVERRVLWLDKETQTPKARFGPMAKAAIDEHEFRLTTPGIWRVYEGDLAENLRLQRLLLARQLASVEEIKSDNAVCGTDLLRNAVACTPVYEHLVDWQWGKVDAAFRTSVAEFLGFLIQYGDVGGWLGEKAAWAGKKLAELPGGRRVLAALSWLADSVAETAGLIRDALGAAVAWRATSGNAALEAMRSAAEQYSIVVKEAFAEVAESGRAGMASAFAQLRMALTKAFEWLWQLLRFIAIASVSSMGRLAIVTVSKIEWMGSLLARSGRGVDLVFGEGASRITYGTRAGERMQQILGAGAPATPGVFALGKFLESVLNWVIEWLTDRLSGFKGSGLEGVDASRFLFGWAAASGTSGLQGRVAALTVPAVSGPPLGVFAMDTRGSYEHAGWFGGVEADARWWLVQVDRVVLFVEGIVAIAALLASFGTLLPPVLLTMQTVETAVAAIKTALLGIIPLGWHAVLWGFFAWLFGRRVAATATWGTP